MATLIQGSSLAPVNTDRSLGPYWPSGNSGFLLAKSLPGPMWPRSISGFLPAKSLLGPNWPSSMSGFLSNKKLAWTKVANLIQACFAHAGFNHIIIIIIIIITIIRIGILNISKVQYQKVVTECTNFNQTLRY